jgi:hypothetical protein
MIGCFKVAKASRQGSFSLLQGRHHNVFDIIFVLSTTMTLVALEMRRKRLLATNTQSY